MKKLLQFSTLSILLILIITGIGCTKKEGPVGPAGPAGKTNITPYVFTVSSWSSTSDYWYTNLTIPALTATNIDSASVQVYFSTTNNNWAALPYTQVASTNYFMGYIASPNMVTITWTYNGTGLGSSPTSFYGLNCEFKIVVIPPSIRTRNKKTKGLTFRTID